MSESEAPPQESTEPLEVEPGINPEPELEPELQPEPEPEPEERELSAFEQAMVDEVAQGEDEANDGEGEKQSNGEASVEDTRYADEAEALEGDIPTEKGEEGNNEPPVGEENGNTTTETQKEEKPREEPKKSGDPVADKNKLFIGFFSSL